VETESTATQIDFEGVSGRRLVAAFDGGHVSSDGGLVLLHRVDRQFGLLKRIAACVQDHRVPELIRHSVEELVRQRVYGIACGYEDLVDHASLLHHLETSPLSARRHTSVPWVVPSKGPRGILRPPLPAIGVCAREELPRRPGASTRAAALLPKHTALHCR
jgi:Transposase DDE domain group 1